MKIRQVESTFLHVQAVVRDGADGALLPADTAPLISQTMEVHG